MLRQAFSCCGALIWRRRRSETATRRNKSLQRDYNFTLGCSLFHSSLSCATVWRAPQAAYRRAARSTRDTCCKLEWPCRNSLAASERERPTCLLCSSYLRHLRRAGQMNTCLPAAAYLIDRQKLRANFISIFPLDDWRRRRRRLRSCERASEQVAAQVGVSRSVRILLSVKRANAKSAGAVCNLRRKKKNLYRFRAERAASFKFKFGARQQFGLGGCSRPTDTRHTHRELRNCSIQASRPLQLSRQTGGGFHSALAAPAQQAICGGSRPPSASGAAAPPAPRKLFIASHSVRLMASFFWAGGFFGRELFAPAAACSFEIRGAHVAGA